MFCIYFSFFVIVLYYFAYNSFAFFGLNFYDVGMERNELAKFVKSERKKLGFTQEQLALYTGVGIAFLRALEQGKTNLSMTHVNRVLWLFGYEVGPIKKGGAK